MFRELFYSLYKWGQNLILSPFVEVVGIKSGADRFFEDEFAFFIDLYNDSAFDRITLFVKFHITSDAGKTFNVAHGVTNRFAISS